MREQMLETSYGHISALARPLLLKPTPPCRCTGDENLKVRIEPPARGDPDLHPPARGDPDLHPPAKCDPDFGWPSGHGRP